MKVLVSYFSASGVTKNVASRLADLLNADLEEIKPTRTYSDADLDWQDSQSRSSIEMKDETARPEIEKPVHDPSEYDIVFVGYPIWWYAEPRIVDTYLDRFDLAGRRIIPFATSGSSSIHPSVSHLRRLYPKARIEEGFLLNHGIDEDKIREMIKGGK